MFYRLLKLSPAVAGERLAALAEVWSIERNRIIARMLEICRTEIGPVMASDARPSAIFELAKLIMWLEERIIAKKLEIGPIEQIDPEAERRALETSSAQERIENTARICAEKIWKPLLAEWHRRFPLISAGERQARKLVRRREEPGVKSQHYSPSFSNKLWAIGSQKLVRVYSRSVAGSIIASDRGYATWAREIFLYSQGLERMLQLTESDGERADTKLLEMIPLTEKEHRCWIAFLLAQLLRTPSFALRILPALKQHIKREEIMFRVDTGSLRQAYETLFSNNDLYAEFHRLITGGVWELWSAPAWARFIRGDNPVIVHGSTAHGTWQLHYPMTPAKCFVVGGEKVSEAVPRTRVLSESDVRMVNHRIARGARRSVIAQPVDEDSDMKLLLEDALPQSPAVGDWQAQVFPEFWGPVA
jgi:hypothetical protein